SALRHRRAPRDRGPGHPRLRGAGRRAAPDRPRRRARGAGARAERAPSRAQRSDPARREREGARMDRRLRMTRWASAAALALALVCCSPAAAAAAMPAAIALAANFDPAMARRYGAAVGAEVRHRGFDGDFGPTVNIMRTPLGGRTFEAYGEDPFLSAQTAVGWIDGFQSQGVMADVKHFAANNQEGQLGVSPVWGVVGSRSHVNVHADPRTLHEVELV